MAKPAFLARSWYAGEYICTLRISLSSSGTFEGEIQWIPKRPKQLVNYQLLEYRIGRDNAMNDLARELGIPASILKSLIPSLALTSSEPESVNHQASTRLASACASLSANPSASRSTSTAST